MNAEEIVRAYSDMVFKIAYRHVMNREDAEDVYSEVFLAYFKKDRSFESEEHRKAWLIRVTVNCAKDLLVERSHSVPMEEVEVPVEDENADEILTLRQAIDRLPQRQKEVICLFYDQDLTIKQIAAALEISEANVKTTLFRAREHLKMFLGE